MLPPPDELLATVTIGYASPLVVNEIAAVEDCPRKVVTDRVIVYVLSDSSKLVGMVYNILVITPPPSSREEEIAVR
jgi:hypothetical protein